MVNILKDISFSNKKWIKAEEDNLIIDQISRIYSIDRVIAGVLYKRKVDLKEIQSFLDPKIKNQLKDPYKIRDMEKACSIIYEALNKKTKIVILGDYDVDGITSTAILVKYLKKLKAEVISYIPDRYTEGYGISMKSLKNIEKFGADLLILLDNGSSAVAEIAKAKEMGMKVVIIDHHVLDINMPNADAIINPKRIDDYSEEHNLCTVGLVFLFLIALNTYLERQNYYKQNDCSKEDIMKYLDLVALGTVCDMVPLRGLNRSMVFQGIKLMQKRNNHSLKALSDNLGLNKPLDVETLAFSFGPCINSGSRMGDSNIALNLFLAEDSSITNDLARKLIKINHSRQQEEDRIIQSAVQLIDKMDIHGSSCIFVGSQDWMAGIVGIIAGRIKDNYAKPALIYAIDKNTGIATCSGRSIDSVNIGDIIIGAKQKGLILKGGGHAMAVGFSFDITKKDDIFNFFNDKISQKITNNAQTESSIVIDDIISLKAVNIEFAENIQNMQPFGIDFSEPMFMLNNVQITYVRQIGENKNHIMVELNDGFNAKAKAFCYKCLPGKLGDTLIKKEGERVDLVVALKVSVYQAKLQTNLVIRDIG